jgi:probable DNA repair protein
MADAFPALEKAELFAQLAAGHAAGLAVVTPNRRLAQAIAAEFDERQLAAGRTAWESADILPYPAFVERLYDDALHGEAGAGLPLLLTPDQAQSLWEEIVRRSPQGRQLLAIPETAAHAADAWTLAHAWQLLERLERTPLDDDGAAFLGWASAYGTRIDRDRLTDRARLPAIVAGLLDDPRMKKPRQLVAYGFDVVTPQQRAFLQALAARGVRLATCGPARRAGAAVRVAALDARDESALAARWARARLEANPGARIAIVVPDLATRRNALARTLARTMDPGGTAAVLPFNISLGAPLADRPLVAHALDALALGGRELEFERASALIRSPFIAGGETELHARARLDARLRRRAEPLVRLDRLVGQLDGGPDAAPALARTLGRYAEFRKAHLFAPRAPGDWARTFSDALALLGFPGERTLDSGEYQTLKKWHEVVARFAALDRVAGTLGFNEALARLARMAAGTLFQPETPQVPVQVLGAIEAAGMTFDHLWVMGLSDETWPPAARPNPFVPLRLQRAAGVPNASPAAALERARALTAEWLGCAGEVVLSHPRRDADRDLAPSPLVAALPAGEPALPEHLLWRDAIQRAAAVERIDDAPAPATGARAGTGLFKDEAACPFRAFGVHRLRAAGLESPHAGLDALERGTLVHRVLAAIWERLGSKAALDALDAPALEALLGTAADEAIRRKQRERPTALGGRFAAVERARLVRIAREWLDAERGRSGFTVLATEAQRAATLGALDLRLRLDRVDRLDSGERVVIDYKTGRASVASLLGPRPDEPQLPLYLTAVEPDAAAVALAQVRVGDMKFAGLARAPGLIPGAGVPEAGWAAQRAAWRAELERLADEFAAGGAAVDPKRPGETCRLCDLHPLCRIRERSAEER